MGDNRHSVSDIAKIKSLGWSPRRNLDRIMDDFLTWIDQPGVLPSGISDTEELMRAGGVVRATIAGNPA